MAYLRKQTNREIQLYYKPNSKNKSFAITFYKDEKQWQFYAEMGGDIEIRNNPASFEALHDFNTKKEVIFNLLNFPDIFLDYILSKDEAKMLIVRDYIFITYLKQ